MAPGGRHDHLIEELEDLFQICFAQTRAPSHTVLAICLIRELGLDLNQASSEKIDFNENEDALFPHDVVWPAEESKALDEDMQAVGHQQADVCIALASAPNIASNTLKEGVHCDQRGTLSLDFHICAQSDERNILASGL